MSQKELAQYVGRTATFVFKAFAELQFTVRIIDTKIEFGQDRVLITPVAGEGEQWVNLESLVLNTNDMREAG
jgi:hypothetical protein